jgi:hypothetical protein
MAEQKPARNDLLLQTLKTELAFFDAGGYGRPFRSGWRPTLLLRDSEACINYNSTGRQASCGDCPLFEMVPAAARNAIVPCHHIPLDARGHTIASIYRKNTQKDLDEHYREWLSALIQKTQQH